MASDGGLGPGTVLDGKYEILKRIGAGGMGEVFKARHLHLNAFRCIKVMKQGLLADDTYRTRFLREARLAVQIHHPNIAVVHDFFVGDGGNYMVTEFIDGTTLRQWSAAHGPFPIALAADVASQVLAGLDHIHRRGLLHRDISPDNVMLSYDADDRLEAKIIDLGIAKDVNTSAADKTMAGVLIGNPKYMSPEQLGLIDEDEELDGRTDLYSLGVVLYEMLLGVPPFASETPQGYIMKHLTQPPARFAEARPGMPVTGGIEQVVFRALEKDRTRRYRDARELAGALEPFLSARAGTLTRDDVSALRRGPEKTLADSIAMIGSNDATIAESGSTEVKARAFEQSLLDDVRARESERDRAALQRLAEAHPRGTAVGDASREALARVVAEEDAFQRAWEDGRAESWRAFLDAHPDSPHGGRAREHLAEATQFESATTDAAVRKFLAAWPAGRHHLEAEIRLARAKEDAAFAIVTITRDPNEVAAFLAQYPDSPRRAEALALQAELRRELEPRDFSAAWENGTAAAWDDFFAEHPDSVRLEEARLCRQEAQDFELAVTTNTPVMWRAFLKTWPEGRHRIDAALRLRAMK